MLQVFFGVFVISIIVQLVLRGLGYQDRDVVEARRHKEIMAALAKKAKDQS